MNKRQSLGQHFLKSQSIAKSIVNFAKITKNDTVLEVGTGKGILTPYLCEKAKHVISIEKDPLLYVQAKESLGMASNLSLEKGDAFKTSHDFTIFVSNLPYSESRRAIEWLVQRRFKRAIIMVQKEFFEKLLVTKGKERRAISVLASYSFEIQNLMDVKNTNFNPPPKIDSVVIQIVPREQLSINLVNAVNKLFSFKRKTLRHIGKKMGVEIKSDKRLEDLTEGEIIEIAKKINK
ncbi:MAG: rRNA adenine dimethyltransferase family protein [Nitrososphaera sp.]|jgi:16S rRNA (adenine1518-N6/adenine1519-N6)-dimethyltransferase